MLSFSASAQRSRAMYNFGGSGGGNTDYGITFGVDYDAPIGIDSNALGGVYKPAPAFDLGLLRYSGNFVLGVNVGYRAYTARDLSDVFAQLNAGLGAIDPSASIGTLVYDDFKTFSTYASAIYNFQLTNNVKFFLGANLGLYFSNFGYTYTDNTSYLSYSRSESELYIAPRSGISFDVGNGADINLQTKYNLFSPLGNKSENPDVGHFYKSVAIGLSFSYRF